MRTLLLMLCSCLLLQGCVYKIVTVPVKAVYTVGKYTVKGTAAVVGAVIPDGDDDDTKSGKRKHQKGSEQPTESGE